MQREPRRSTGRPGGPARWAAFPLAVLLVLAGPTVPADPARAADDPLQRVIVELTGPAAIAAVPEAARLVPGTQPGAGAAPDPAAVRRLSTAREALAGRHKALLDRMGSAGIAVRDERSSTLLANTIAMRVPESQVARLRALPGVTAVHPDRPVKADVDKSVPLIGAPEVWQRTDAAGRPVRGQGVTVAIVDTGIDYTNPSLGAGFGPGKRVVAGYDFANDDADPMDDNGHGTHVAGIAAGNGAVTGVAPDAELTAYKVMNRDGAGYESWILAGIEAAADPANPHRADVINMSLGAPGDGTDLIGRAATAAARSGVVVVASAGNSGPAAQSIGSPAAADQVISVAASVSGLTVPTARLEAPVKTPLQTYRAGISANPPSQPVTGEVVNVGRGTPAELDQAGDLRGKIAFLFAQVSESAEYTSPLMIEQARDMERRGVVAALTYQEGAGPVGADAAGTAAARTAADEGPGQIAARPGARDSGDSFRMDKLVLLGMDPTQRDELGRHLAAGPVRVSISGTDATDRLASFSSRGPSDRFTLKPDLTAPGVEIRSTWPTRQWAPGEFRLSGTSMAAPHVAGAAALLRQARPTLSVPHVRAALVGSARPLAELGPTEQGAGRLDLPAAIAAEVVAEPATLSLGLADMANPGAKATGTVSVRNLGSGPAVAKFGATPAGDSIGTVEITPRQATIPAGGAVDVRVTVAASTVDLARDSNLSGWLTADLPGDADLRVPYLLAVRPLIVYATPDPSDGRTEAFVNSPTPLRGVPTVRVVPRNGKAFDVVAQHDHDSWYRVGIDVEKVGVYRVEARAWAATGQRLTGTDDFEVVAPENRPGADRWESAGPNSNAARLTTIPNAPHRGILQTGASAALWLTDDRGESWQRVDRLPVGRGGAGSVVVDPRDDQRIWYAVNGQSHAGLNMYDPTYQGKILVTENRGRTWTTLDFPDTHIHQLLGTSDGRTLVAVTDDGFHLSRDRGRTWAAYGQDWGGAVVGAALNGSTLVVAGLRTIFAVPGVTGEPQPVRRVLESPTNNFGALDASRDRALVVRGDGSVWGATDASTPWQQLGRLPSFGGAALRIVGADAYIASYTQDYVSRDGGRTWNPQAKPVQGPMNSDFDRWPGAPSSSVLVSADRGGLWHSTDDGASFSRIGVPGLTAYDVAIGQGADGGQVLVTSTDSDTYRRSLPTGQLRPADVEWGTAAEGRLTGVEGLLAASAGDGRSMWKTLYYPFTSEVELRLSTDGGGTWIGKRRIRGQASTLLVHPADSNRVVASISDTYGAGLMVTRDGGTTWKNLYHGQTFTAVAGDPTDPDRLWLGSDSGLYRSDDLGTTITKVTDGRVEAVYAGADGRVVAGGDTIRVSDNDGRTFATADTGGLPMRVSDIVAVPGKPRTLYAGTDAYFAYGLPRNGRGVLRSTDGGRTWHNVSGGLQATSVTSLAVSPDGRWLFAGTVDAGVHRLRIR